MTTMTTSEQVRVLSTMSSRDEAGRHFTERYSDELLAELESAGLITIDRPVHEATGMPYSREHWSLEVTEAGTELVQANPEDWDATN